MKNTAKLHTQIIQQVFAVFIALAATQASTIASQMV